MELEQAIKRIETLEQLLIDLLPDMEARVNGLQCAWPGKEVKVAVKRNEFFVTAMKELIETKGDLNMSNIAGNAKNTISNCVPNDPQCPAQQTAALDIAQFAQ